MTDQAYQYNESLTKVNDVYQKHLGDMRKLIKYQGRTDWEEYSDGEKLMIQNTALLVGLLYKMCKQALVIPAKEKSLTAFTDTTWSRRLVRISMLGFKSRAM